MLSHHLNFVSDTVRVAAFNQCIESLGLGEKVVADLGCGTGILGQCALNAGAKRVYFVDDGSILDAARLTLLNRFGAERCAFVNGRSQAVELPEAVDAVLCDHVGFFGVDYGIIDLLDDARRRHMKPDGVVVPGSIRLNAALASSTESHLQISDWRSEKVPEEFRWMARLAADEAFPVKFNSSQIVSTEGKLGKIVFSEKPAGFTSWETEVRSIRDAHAHGLVGWFDCDLSPVHAMTNSPCNGGRIDRAQLFFPFLDPLQIRSGECFNLTFMMRPFERIIAWVLESDAGLVLRGQHHWGEKRSVLGVDRKQPLQLNRFGRAFALISACCDGKRPFNEVVDELLEHHGDTFCSADAARSELSAFLARYGRQ
jgi:protein arginine N-methyltransferase 1